MEAENRTKYLPEYSIGLICCMVYFMISCSQADEIALYYKTGFIASPVSKSFDSFEKEASSHSVDTIIYVKAEDILNAARDLGIDTTITFRTEHHRINWDGRYIDTKQC